MALGQKGWTALAFGVAAAMMGLLGWATGGNAQTITEYPLPTPNSTPTPITLGPDGALWFIAEGCSEPILTCDTNIARIGRITTSGAITEYPPTPDYLPDIVTGPDGALWFTDDGCDYSGCNPIIPGRIGRITTSGAITGYPPSSDNFGGIAAGPDGALWFVDRGSTIDMVDRLTLSGTVTTFTIPNRTGDDIVGVVTGPDGALWFNEALSNNIGRITTSGVISEFPVPTPAAGVDNGAFGPDGAGWFTEFSGNKIGRITTSGVITEYPIPTSGADPFGIAAGPDGAMWFAEVAGNKIGRITASGVITEYPLPTPGSDPIGITAGPDGALWFTEILGNKIGRITTPLSTHRDTSDFTADGKSDILLQNASGQAEIWLMNGTTPTTMAPVPVGANPGPSWRAIGTGDFYGNGYSDILWQNIGTGEVYIWEMNATKVIGGGSPGNPGTSWHAIGTGDFNGDGKADILLQNASGQAAIWLMNGAAPITPMTPVGANPGPSWRAIGTGDFYGNGYSDILWQNTTSGEVYIWEINGTKVIGGGSPGNPGPSWHVIGTGDFNGDGKADILLQNASGQAAIWLMNGAAPITAMALVGANPGTSWHAIGTGDFYGTGYSDILWQNSTSGEVYIWEINGTKVIGGGSPGNPGTSWHAIGEWPAA